MSRAPLYALTAAISLLAAIVMTVHRTPDLKMAAVAPAPPVQDGPPSTGQVLAGAVEASALTEVEMLLTEEAAARGGTTTTTTVPESPAADSPVAATPAESSEAPATTSTTTANATTTSTTTTSTTTTPTTTAPPEEAQPAGQFDAAAEAEFASLINSYRSSNGKGALSRNGSLDAHARDWAKYMADNGSLAHSNLNSLMPPWALVAENVGTGASVSAIFGLLKGSSSHASNMLGDFTHLGVGVWREADGTLWTSHVFARS